MSYDDSFKTKNFVTGVVAGALTTTAFIAAVTVGTARADQQDTARLEACVASGQQYYVDATGYYACTQEVGR